MKTSKIAFAALVVFAQLFSTSTNAAIPKNNYAVEYYTSVLPVSEEAEEVEIVRIELPKTTHDDVARWIPLDLQDGSEGRVFGRILTRGLQNALRETTIGQAAQRVQKAVAQDIAIGGSEEDSLQHVFKFRVEAEKTQARLNYEGLLNAQLTYELSADELKFEVRESIARDTSLVLSHIDNSEDRRETLAVHFNF